MGNQYHADQVVAGPVLLGLEPGFCKMFLFALVTDHLHNVPE